MVVIDSSVWIDNMRGADNGAVRKLLSITTPSEILVGDLMLFELLQGARDEGHAGRIEQYLGKFSFVEMVNSDLARRAAGNYRRLRALGVTIRKSIDLLIATFCIEGDHTLLHNDHDFTAMEKHLGLRVF